MKNYLLTFAMLLALGCASSSGSPAVFMELGHITEGDPPLGTVLRVTIDGRILIERVGGPRGARICGRLSEESIMKLESHLEAWMATEPELLPQGSWHAERYQVAFEGKHRTVLRAKMPSAVMTINDIVTRGLKPRCVKPFTELFLQE